jgi:hypothetical protein
VKELDHGQEGAPANRPSDPDTELVITVEFESDRNVSAPKAASHFMNAITITSRQAEAKGVKVGKMFQAHSMYQTRGTCNPGPYLADFDEWK